MSKKGVSQVVSAVLLISLVIATVTAFSYVYTNFLYEQQDSIEGTVFEEIGLGGCNPAYECSEWSQCKIDYKFEDLTKKDLQLNGVSKRNCLDSNECSPEKTEEQVCSAKELITINVVKENGKEYVEIKDKDGNIISKIDKDEKSGKLYIDLYA